MNHIQFLVLARSSLAAFTGGALFAILISTGLADGAVAQELDDPLEPMNRAVFGFNEFVDRNVLEPVAKGYDKVLPRPVKRGVSNFFQNLSSPIYFVSDVLQLKATQAGTTLTRFVLNSTLGLAGTIDVAKEFGILHEEDLGIAMAYYGVPSGPYLVLPILGPSTIRDGIGMIGDGFLHPLNYVDDAAVMIGGRVIEGIDTRRKLIEAIDVGRDSSLDYYTFVKSSWYQSRLNDIYDGDIPPELLEELPEDPEIDVAVEAADAEEAQ